jgi:hypothetical protein
LAAALSGLADVFLPREGFFAAGADFFARVEEVFPSFLVSVPPLVAGALR